MQILQVDHALTGFCARRSLDSRTDAQQAQSQGKLSDLLTPDTDRIKKYYGHASHPPCIRHFRVDRHIAIHAVDKQVGANFRGMRV
jgi:hypothetical protein